MSGTFFGAKGVNHIGAEDFASLMDSIFDGDSIIEDVDDGLTLTMTDANTATLSTGGAICEGYYFHNKVADSIAVASGSVGYNRIDLVVLRYTEGEVEGRTVQAMTPTLIQGDATVGTPEPPSYHEGSIDGGDVMVDFPIYQLTHEGVQTPTVTRIMDKKKAVQKQLTDGDAALQSQITALGESVSSKLKVVTVEVSLTISRGDDSLASNDLPSVSGYKPIGVVGTSSNGANVVSFSYISGGKLFVYLRNYTPGTGTTTITATGYVLYATGS